MQKSRASKLAKTINYFANEYGKEIWEANFHVYFEKEWCVEVELANGAFRHELNALMMVINSTIAASCHQRIDNNGEIIWAIW